MEIVLTDIGETLVASGAPEIEIKNNGIMMQHAYCEGYYVFHVISETHNALTCGECHRTVAFPNTVRTFGDLLKHFARFNS